MRAKSDQKMKVLTGDDRLDDHVVLAELLEKSVFNALKTYSNVHRGSGHKSVVSTALLEHAREIVLDYLGLNPGKYTVIFCTPLQAAGFKEMLLPGKFKIISSRELGLSIGIRAIAVKNSALPRGVPPQSGGGTTKLVSREWVIWAKAPAKFEAGTPPVINIITFARALQIMKKVGANKMNMPERRIRSAREILSTGFPDGASGSKLLEEVRRSRIGLNLPVPTLKGEQVFINFDNSASTSTFLPVWDTFRHTMYMDGSEGKRIIQEVRKVCSGFLGASLENFDILFTGNATESINMVAGSLGKGEVEEGIQPVIACTLMEHSSNDLPWRYVPGHSLIRIPVDKEGFMDHAAMEELLEQNSKGNRRVRLVAVSAASNVLGTCNDLKAISETVHRFGAALLVDGAQLVAHRKAEVELNGIDYFVFSAHKIYAPFGCGVLVARKGLLNHTPLETDRIRESGEENIAGIAALGMSLNILGSVGMQVIEKEEQELTALVLREMQKIPAVMMAGIKEYDGSKLARRVGVIPFNLKNSVSFRVGKELALYSGIGVRVGCHCAHILVKHVLGVGPGLERFQRIMQTVIPAISFPGVVRISLGIENTGEDVKKLTEALEQIAGKHNREKSGHSGKEMKRILSVYTKECTENVFGPV